MKSVSAVVALCLAACACGARIRARETPDEVKLGADPRTKLRHGRSCRPHRASTSPWRAPGPWGAPESPQE
eukprot:12171634-Alexandrium_andersonii.AAC.1